MHKLLILTACLGLTLSGCSSPSPNNSPTPVSTPTPQMVTTSPIPNPMNSPSPSPIATLSPSPVTPTPTPNQNNPQPCKGSQLQLTMGGTQGAAGHIFIHLILTNFSSTPCTIYGYPTAQLLNGSPVPTRVVDRGGELASTAPPTMFLLSPNQMAGFQASYGDVPVNNETCKNVSSIEVGPPGEAPNPTLAITGLTLSVCNTGEVDVSALVALS